MKNERDTEMKLAELAVRSGVPARTVRLYIAQGILAGPLRSGRGAAYGPEHLKTLQSIRRMQSEGLTLAEIWRALAGGAPVAGLPEPTQWSCYAIAPDVLVWTSASAHPWRLRQINHALQAFKDNVDSLTKPNKDLPKGGQ
jgi:DNA-binding transcriptional MerR regulator